MTRSEVLAWQRSAGLDVLTDGEMRRDAWQTNFGQAVEGFEDDYPVREIEMPDGRKQTLELHTKAVVSKLRQTRRLAQVDAAFLREHAPGRFKRTKPSPAMLVRGSWRPGVSDAAYPAARHLYRDVVDIIRDEMMALVAEGVRYIQLD